MIGLETPLTARQREVHRFMFGYQAEHGMPPSYREILDHFGFRSTQAVAVHIRALAKKGYVKIHGKALSRSAVAVDPDARRCECCGQAIRHATERSQIQ